LKGCFANTFKNNFFNPLSAKVVHARHDTDDACSGCSASYRQNLLKVASVFLKEVKIVYYALYLSQVNRQKPLKGLIICFEAWYVDPISR